MYDLQKRVRKKTPEPGSAVRSYDGGMVPENWREIVAVYDEAIEHEIDKVVVGTVSCVCKPGDDPCSNCEASDGLWKRLR